VARNIFLGGKSFQDSRSVQRIPRAADVSIGAVLMLSRARLTANYTFRSGEFEAQPWAAQYGSISLSVRF